MEEASVLESKATRVVSVAVEGSKEKGESMLVLCAHCGTQTEESKEFCSRACSVRSRLPFLKRSVSAPAANANPPTCLLQGCRSRASFTADHSSKRPSYCSEDHYTRSMSVACLQCKDKPSNHRTLFCSKTCLELAEKNAPTLLEIPSHHVAYKRAHEMFKNTWYTPLSAPKVNHIYKVLLPREMRERYESHRSIWREELRWHGTIRFCNLGDGGRTQTCNDDSCSLCKILKNSYKRECSRSYPKRIFSAATSAYSNSFSRDCAQSETKAILLNKVCIGIRMKGRGIFTVRSNDAIRPEFLLIYDDTM